VCYRTIREFAIQYVWTPNLGSGIVGSRISESCSAAFYRQQGSDLLLFELATLSGHDIKGFLSRVSSLRIHQTRPNQ
jgi:hypothetical protein